MVSANTPLMEAGVDSLGATELQRGLSEQLSTEFEATLLFDHPSIDSIVSCYTASGATLVDAVGVSLTSTARSALTALEEAQISLALTTETPELVASRHTDIDEFAKVAYSTSTEGIPPVEREQEKPFQRATVDLNYVR